MKDHTKYGKYIQLMKDCCYEESQGPGILAIEHSMCPNANTYFVHWVVPDGTQKEPQVGHPPHVHKENELLFFIGGDPEHPEELGGVFEISFGEEMERHIIDKTCCITIPGGLPHGRYIIHDTKRAWMFVRVHEGPARTEKPRQDLLSAEERAQIRYPKQWAIAGFDENDEDNKGE